ncbi:hypothetical protein KSX_04730 [Ktedonospora formicarum]|uniref:Uncharacterized protein n=1 Tax=Ktedonospora formicarum TaxID=2778364 RepID=A0A8J3MNV8_9CHLR|nr:hypothetical protein KSX_04730 [Ktedonospora formicarum]
MLTWEGIWTAAAMVLPVGTPFGEAGFAFKPFLKAFDSLLIFVGNLCIKDRPKGLGF